MWLVDRQSRSHGMRDGLSVLGNGCCNREIRCHRRGGWGTTARGLATAAASSHGPKAECQNEQGGEGRKRRNFTTDQKCHQKHRGKTEERGVHTSCKGPICLCMRGRRHNHDGPRRRLPIQSNSRAWTAISRRETHAGKRCCSYETRDRCKANAVCRRRTCSDRLRSHGKRQLKIRDRLHQNRTHA